MVSLQSLDLGCQHCLALVSQGHLKRRAQVHSQTYLCSVVAIFEASFALSIASEVKPVSVANDHVS